MEIDYFRVPSLKGDIKIPFAFIVRFEANERYSIVHTISGQQIVHCCHLNAVEKQLKHRKIFFRISKSNIINTELVVNSGYLTYMKRHYVYLHNWCGIAFISRRKEKSFFHFAKKRKIPFRAFSYEN
jgi:DNA-binding LytR/AlgR family response regulator